MCGLKPCKEYVAVKAMTPGSPLLLSVDEAVSVSC